MFAMYYEISHFDLLRIAAGALLVVSLVVVVLVRLRISRSRRKRADHDS